MQVLKKSDKAVEFTYGPNQATLELYDIGKSLNYLECIENFM